MKMLFTSSSCLTDIQKQRMTFGVVTGLKHSVLTWSWCVALIKITCGLWWKVAVMTICGLRQGFTM